MFEGYGSYIRERDEDRIPTVRELEDREARETYIVDRSLELLGSAKLAKAIQDDMTGFYGHESNAIAMMLSQAASNGDFAPLFSRVAQIAKEVAAREWGTK
jgi:hypothetical protein